MTAFSFLARTLGLLLLVTNALEAQQEVPVVELAAAKVRSAARFGTILSVFSMSGGKVLVNDGGRPQLDLLDGTLSNGKVVLDSAASGTNNYGTRAMPLIPYLGDFLLFVYLDASAVYVVDPSGRIARTISIPKTGDLWYVASSPSTTDTRGNLYYRGVFPKTNHGSGKLGPASGIDSAPIIRANFESRQLDTVGRVRIVSPRVVVAGKDERGAYKNKTTINPIVAIDEWAVLADGSLAMVRGNNYHIDWIAPDGRRFSTPKMPFDWRRLSDSDKLALADSARKAEEKADSIARLARMQRSAISDVSSANGSVVQGDGMRVSKAPAPALMVDVVPLSEMADYYPAIRAGAVRADLSGNLWILPTTSAKSTSGELVYDVVNKRGVLITRVRLPVGRSIAGFGPQGVVFLMGRDVSKQWYLERVSVRLE